MKLGDKVVEVLVAGVDVGLCSDRHHLEKYEGALLFNTYAITLKSNRHGSHNPDITHPASFAQHALRKSVNYTHRDMSMVA